MTEVSVGDQTWRFALDVGRGTACVELDGRAIHVACQSWQQKRMLARFAHLGRCNFSKSSFCVRALSASEPPPETAGAREALIALARWINSPGGKSRASSRPAVARSRYVASVPRDSARRRRRSTTLDATDVEMLWQCRVRMDAPETEEAGTQNRIVVIPDEMAHRFRDSSWSNDGPYRNSGNAGPRIVEPEAECLAPEVSHVDEVALHGGAAPKTAPADPRPARRARGRGTAVRVETRRFRVRLGSYAERRVQRRVVAGRAGAGCFTRRRR